MVIPQGLENLYDYRRNSRTEGLGLSPILFAVAGLCDAHGEIGAEIEVPLTANATTTATKKPHSSSKNEQYPNTVRVWWKP
jgi:hypothetical protein